jgi:alkanesulfonate monooxygenase SsuD/methylene tetrahydromethanopterin reductase-like flavin-dependent oxidoreductase (luciferase family)
MQQLWSGKPVTHDGAFFHYRDATITPSPVQQPLPLWIGGRSDAAVRRIARLGSGWFSGLATPTQIAPVIQAIDRACEDAGRPFPAENYGADFAIHIGNADDPAVQASIASMRKFTDQLPEDFIAVGSVAHVRERIDAFRAVGVRTFALRPLAATDAGLLDQTQRIIDEIIPHYATAADR